MKQKFYLNDNWRFSAGFEDRMTDRKFDDSGFETVRIPHTVKETPFNYFDESEYQMVSVYRKHIDIPASWKGSTLKLTIGGAAHQADVFVNGKPAGEHRCGYTAFSMDISDLVDYGAENVIAVRLDSRESLDQPPFGHVIDYMTYGGIYRNVKLEVIDGAYLEDLFIYPVKTEKSYTLHTSARICGSTQEELNVKQFLKKHDSEDDHRLIYGSSVKGSELEFTADPGEVSEWSIDDPALYDIVTVLYEKSSDEVISAERIVTGFRTVSWKEDGFYLNGKKVLIRGLNRHQSYPYAGYAMPDSLQAEDALILKKELGVNAVRTSHYPQSHAFISKCDELGLPVFTEIPGWQHIGGEDWKKQAVENVRDMVTEYRNHPSIILWGVRINESADDHDLYEKTNACARKLDPTRPTGGVRYLKKSELLEDVYTFNDFSYTGGKKNGCENKKDVTSDVKKPYLISENNGHIYPTKSYDDEPHRREHSLRHAKVLDSVAGSGDICGSFSWCMFDYNTHRDFGSGDRICYHGVTDMFRNPKLAAYVYAAQGDEPVLEISSTMDIGEHPESRIGEVWIYTNADSVRMYKNDVLLKEYLPSDSPYKNLPHGPILVDDYVGDAVKEGEDFSPSQTEDVKYLLNMYSMYGMDGLPPKAKLIAAKCLTVHRMTMEQAVGLYSKYIGNWGHESVSYRFDAIKGGKIVKSIVKGPMVSASLEIRCSSDTLTEKETYDAVSVRIRAVDQNGNLLPYYNEPLRLECSGEAKIIGPSVISLKGGMGGTYIRSEGKAGYAELSISGEGIGTVRKIFKIVLERKPQM